MGRSAGINVNVGDFSRWEELDGLLKWCESANVLFVSLHGLFQAHHPSHALALDEITFPSERESGCTNPQPSSLADSIAYWKSGSHLRHTIDENPRSFGDWCQSQSAWLHPYCVEVAQDHSLTELGTSVELVALLKAIQFLLYQQLARLSQDSLRFGVSLICQLPFLSPPTIFESDLEQEIPIGNHSEDADQEIDPSPTKQKRWTKEGEREWTQAIHLLSPLFQGFYVPSHLLSLIPVACEEFFFRTVSNNSSQLLYPLELI